MPCARTLAHRTCSNTAAKPSPTSVGPMVHCSAHTWLAVSGFADRPEPTRTEPARLLSHYDGQARRRERRSCRPRAPSGRRRCPGVRLLGAGLLGSVGRCAPTFATLCATHAIAHQPRTAENKRFLDAEHAVTRFMALLRSYTADRLIEFGCNTLVFLIELCPENQLAVFQLHGIEIIAKFLGKDKSKAIHTQVLCVLAKLSTDIGVLNSAPASLSLSRSPSQCVYSRIDCSARVARAELAASRPLHVPFAVPTADHNATAPPPRPLQPVVHAAARNGVPHHLESGGVLPATRYAAVSSALDSTLTHSRCRETFSRHSPRDCQPSDDDSRGHEPRHGLGAAARAAESAAVQHHSRPRSRSR